MRRRKRLAYLRIKICAYEYHAKLMKNRDLKEQRMKPKKKANADEPICYYLIRFTLPNIIEIDFFGRGSQKRRIDRLFKGKIFQALNMNAILL